MNFSSKRQNWIVYLFLLAFLGIAYVQAKSGTWKSYIVTTRIPEPNNSAQARVEELDKATLLDLLNPRISVNNDKLTALGNERKLAPQVLGEVLETLSEYAKVTHKYTIIPGFAVKVDPLLLNRMRKLSEFKIGIDLVDEDQTIRIPEVSFN